MSFSRANPLGWGLYEVLTSAQMNQVDINQSRAIDGYAGGTYSPSAAIIINNQLELHGNSGAGLRSFGDGINSAIYAEAESGYIANGVSAIGRGTGCGVQGQNASANGIGVKGIGTGTDGIGVHGYSSSSTGIGVKGEGNPGGVFEGYASGSNGLEATGNVAGSGVKGTGGSSGIGVEGIGNGDKAGVKGTGGNGGTSSHGVLAVAGNADQAAGLYTSATYTGTYGVFAESSTFRAAVYAKSTGISPALIVESTSTGAPFRILPSTSDPSTYYEGNIWFYSNGGTNELRCYLNSAVRVIASF